MVFGSKDIDNFTDHLQFNFNFEYSREVVKVNIDMALARASHNGRNQLSSSVGFINLINFQFAISADIAAHQINVFALFKSTLSLFIIKIFLTLFIQQYPDN